MAVRGQVLPVLALALLGLAAVPARALDLHHEVNLRIARISHGQVSAEAVRLRLLPMALETPAKLNLEIARLDLPTLGQNLRQVRFECQPSMQARPDAPELATWACRGPVHWRGGAANWTLSWRSDSDLSDVEVRLAQGRSEVIVKLPLADSPFSAQLRRAPVAWLQVLLPQWQWQEGRIDGRVEQLPDARWHGQVQATALAAQSPDGGVAVAGVNLSGPFDLHRRGNGDLAFAATPTLGAGELLAGPVYVGWPADSEVKLDLSLAGQGKRWQLDHLRLTDQGFGVELSGRVDGAADAWIEAVEARVGIDLALRYERYLDGVMSWLGQRGVSASGLLEVRAGLGPGGRLRRLDAQVQDVDFRHPEGRFDLAGVNGELAFRDDGDAEASGALTWRRLGLSGLPMQAGRLTMTSRSGELHAQAPVVVGLFGGSVNIGDLLIRPVADEGDRVSASVALRDIDMTALATAFGWPAFPGRLDAELPRLRYASERLAVDGKLDIEAFGGGIDIGSLAIERPFGVAPALAADVQMRGLDLQPMTEVFGFGRIEGRLDADISGLRLLDWRPVAFDASLRTHESGRRRISQLAVEQLTRIGGGGSVAGLQGRLLSTFDSFGYRRIGLSCRLANDVCEMGGIEGEDGGYTILQGAGLPQITIRGFQRRVDWPILIGRLQAMLAGATPTVE